ncbi:hypothetical protein EPO34_01810 [Patescibacteria group bacterium]|nr:MAG: hypothetical protein EPO34_01810 [Patescibacteria group bacterium]
MDEVLRELMHLGLSEKEAAVYAASLELGPAPVQDIAHKSKVNRATTYVMIESLAGRGLMSTFVRGKKRFFVPESPDRLRSILRMERREIEEKELEFEKVLPTLLGLFNVEGAKPQIRYLEGVEGKATMREVFLSLKGEYVQIVPLDDVEANPTIMKTRPEHVAEVEAQGAFHRALLVTSPGAAERLPRVKNGEVRYLPPEKFPLHAEITVRGSHVFLVNFKSAPLSIVIVSKEIADAIRIMFDLAWAGASEYPVLKV